MGALVIEIDAPRTAQNNSTYVTCTLRLHDSSITSLITFEKSCVSALALRKNEPVTYMFGRTLVTDAASQRQRGPGLSTCSG